MVASNFLINKLLFFLKSIKSKPMKEISRRASAAQILLTVAAFVVVIAGLRASVTIVVPFLLAVFIAIISASPLFWLQRKGLPIWLALIIVIIGVLLIGFLISGLVGSSIKDFSDDLPSYDVKLRALIAGVVTWLESHKIDTAGLAVTKLFDTKAAMKLVAGGLNSLGQVLANGLLILMIVIFILIEASSFPVKLHTIFGDEKNSLENFDKFIDTVKQYMAIKTWMSLATGIAVSIGLAIVGVNYAVLWGLLAFFLNYVPNIGSIIAAIPAVLLALIQLGFVKSIIVAVGYVVINLVVGNVIEPRFMGRGLGLSTLVVFLSLLFWGWVLGPVGMLLSVPLTMTAKIALDSREETQWLAILLGPEIPAKDTVPTNEEDKIID
jgi:predicted PurR-regulated permease PerM